MTDSQPAPSLQPLPASPGPQGPTGPRRGNPAGIAALIIGVVALLFGIGALAGTFLGLPGWLIVALEALGFFLGFVAVVVGIVALVLRNRRKAAGAIGLIVGIIAGLAVIVSVVVGVVSGVGGFVSSPGGALASALAHGGLPTDLSSAFPTDLASDLPTDLQSLLPSAGPALAAGPHTVVYSVTGTGQAAIAYNSSLDADTSNPTQLSGQTLPYEKTLTVTSTGDAQTIFNLDAGGTEGSGAIECKITVDGTVVADKTSSGTLRVAVCVATLGG